MTDPNAGDPTLVPSGYMSTLPSFGSYDETNKVFTFTPSPSLTGGPFDITYYTYDNQD